MHVQLSFTELNLTRRNEMTHKAIQVSLVFMFTALCAWGMIVLESQEARNAKVNQENVVVSNVR